MSRIWNVGRWVLSYAVVAILVIYAVLWVGKNWSKISSAISLSPVHIAALLPLATISVVLMGLMTQLTANHLGARLRFRQWLSLAFASTMVNYILPLKAGMALRGTYFKRCHGFPISLFASTMVAVYVITLLVNSIVGCVILVWLWLQANLANLPLMVAFLTAGFGCVVMLRFSPKVRKDQQMVGLMGFVRRIRLGWDTLRNDAGLMVRVAVVSLALTVVYAVRLYIAFLALGHSVSPAGCLLMASLVALCTFISITPASLGIREVAIIFCSMVLGVEPEVSLLAAALDRAAPIVILAILGPIAMISITRETAKSSTGSQSLYRKESLNA